eukprot:755008-Hanusia_phi.AAC.1
MSSPPTCLLLPPAPHRRLDPRKLFAPLPLTCPVPTPLPSPPLYSTLLPSPLLLHSAFPPRRGRLRWLGGEQRSKAACSEGRGGAGLLR